MTDDTPKFIWSIIALAIGFLFAIAFGGCKTIYKEIPVEHIEYRTEFIDKIVTDSVFQHDSIYIKMLNDTIYEYRDKYIYKYQYIHDTCNVLKVDSVPYTVEIEKPLDDYSKFKMQVGGVTIPFLIVIICVLIGMAIRKFFK